MQTNGSIKPYLLSKLDYAKKLLYSNPESIENYVAEMRDAITAHASILDPYKNVYDSDFIISKHELSNADWRLKCYNYSNANTGGGSTNKIFQYSRWDDAYNIIEGDMHYKEILEEFNVVDIPNILVLFLNDFSKFGWIINENESHLIHRHGADKAKVWHARRDSLYESSRSDYYSRLFQFLDDNKMDILLSGGHSLVSLNYYAKKLKYSGKIAHLLSNTYERLPCDAHEMKENGYFDSICDHMRCWDGGATFMTCKFGTYHLLDNLSYVESIDDKMVSTDYFSIASPFVKYWNGDYCRTINGYHKCECGRYYRLFRMIKPRSILIGDAINDDLLGRIDEAGIRCIKSAGFDKSTVRLVVSRNLTDEEINSICDITGLKVSLDIQSEI